MSIGKIIGKIVATPIRIVDIPFRIVRELAEDPEPERGVLADIAQATQKAVEQVIEGGD